ncbi:MAG: hypothetical protein KDC83_06670 [Flavobacteriales bacterium]|nr:hypothetical protein [Flavobacteriales bacterium]
MKKKFLNIVLIFFILGIWGYIANLVFGPFNEKTEEVTHPLKSLIQKKRTDTVAHYALLNNYPDPFKVNRNVVRIARTASTKATTPPKRPKINPTVKVLKWPSIEYKGCIVNHSSKSEIALIKVDGKNYRKMENEFAADLQIQKIWKDSIKVALNNNSRVAYLN